MENIASVRPNMAVLNTNRMTLTPFGALSQALAEEILARAGQTRGDYPFVPLEYLQEPEPEEQPPARKSDEPAINLELKLILQREGEAGRQEREETARRIVDRIVRLRDEVRIQPEPGDGRRAGGTPETGGNIYQSFFQNINQHISFAAGLPAASAAISENEDASLPGGVGLKSQRFTKLLQTLREDGAPQETVSGSRESGTDTMGSDAPSSEALRPARESVSRVTPEELALVEGGGEPAPALRETAERELRRTAEDLAREIVRTEREILQSRERARTRVPGEEIQKTENNLPEPAHGGQVSGSIHNEPDTQGGDRADDLREAPDTRSATVRETGSREAGQEAKAAQDRTRAEGSGVEAGETTSGRAGTYIINNIDETAPVDSRTGRGERADLSRLASPRTIDTSARDIRTVSEGETQPTAADDMPMPARMAGEELTLRRGPGEEPGTLSAEAGHPRSEGREAVRDNTAHPADTTAGTRDISDRARPSREDARATEAAETDAQAAKGGAETKTRRPADSAGEAAERPVRVGGQDTPLAGRTAAARDIPTAPAPGAATESTAAAELAARGEELILREQPEGSGSTVHGQAAQGGEAREREIKGKAAAPMAGEAAGGVDNRAGEAAHDAARSRNAASEAADTAAGAVPGHTGSPSPEAQSRPGTIAESAARAGTAPLTSGEPMGTAARDIRTAGDVIQATAGAEAGIGTAPDAALMGIRGEELILREEPGESAESRQVRESRGADIESRDARRSPSRRARRGATPDQTVQSSGTRDTTNPAARSTPTAGAAEAVAPGSDGGTAETQAQPEAERSARSTQTGAASASRPAQPVSGHAVAESRDGGAAQPTTEPEGPVSQPETRAGAEQAPEVTSDRREGTAQAMRTAQTGAESGTTQTAAESGPAAPGTGRLTAPELLETVARDIRTAEEGAPTESEAAAAVPGMRGEELIFREEPADAAFSRETPETQRSGEPPRRQRSIKTPESRESRERTDSRTADRAQNVRAGDDYRSEEGPSPEKRGSNVAQTGTVRAADTQASTPGGSASESGTAAAARTGSGAAQPEKAAASQSAAEPGRPVESAAADVEGRGNIQTVTGQHIAPQNGVAGPSEARGTAQLTSGGTLSPVARDIRLSRDETMTPAETPETGVYPAAQMSGEELVYREEPEAAPGEPAQAGTGRGKERSQTKTTAAGAQNALAGENIPGDAPRAPRPTGAAEARTQTRPTPERDADTATTSGHTGAAQAEAAQRGAAPAETGSAARDSQKSANSTATTPTGAETAARQAGVTGGVHMGMPEGSGIQVTASDDMSAARDIRTVETTPPAVEPAAQAVPMTGEELVLREETPAQGETSGTAPEGVRRSGGERSASGDRAESRPASRNARETRRHASGGTQSAETGAAHQGRSDLQSPGGNARRGARTDITEPASPHAGRAGDMTPGLPAGQDIKLTSARMPVTAARDIRTAVTPEAGIETPAAPSYPAAARAGEELVLREEPAAGEPEGRAPSGTDLAAKAGETAAEAESDAGTPAGLRHARAGESAGPARHDIATVKPMETVGSTGRQEITGTARTPISGPELTFNTGSAATGQPETAGTALPGSEHNRSARSAMTGKPETAGTSQAPFTAPELTYSTESGLTDRPEPSGASQAPFTAPELTYNTESAKTAQPEPSGASQAPFTAPELTYKTAQPEPSGATPTPAPAPELTYRTGDAGDSGAARSASTARPVRAGEGRRALMAPPPERDGVTATGSPAMAGIMGAGSPSPVELTYSQAGPRETPPADPTAGNEAAEERGNGFRGQDSAFVKSLPEWAQKFLREGPAGGTLPQTIPTVRNIASQPFETPEAAPQMIEWTAPGFRDRPPTETQLREPAKRSAETPRAESVQLSDAEIRRTADRVYKIIEDRIRRERRRLGL